MNRRRALYFFALLVLGSGVLVLALRRGGSGPRFDGLSVEATGEAGGIRPLRDREVRSLLLSARSSPRPGAPGPPPLSALERVTQILLGADGQADAGELPREALDRWLESGHTNAADLLAARQAGGGVEFLRRALKEFPDDPRVLIQAASLDDGPEARRDRLDRLKAVAPDNALADYLSAQDHLKNGRIEAALADLQAAASKRGFEDYTMEAALNGEELYLQAGRPAVEAKALGTSTVLLPHLAELKVLATEMGALERRYVEAGDTASAEAVARMGLQLGQRMVSEASPHTLVHDLSGSALEVIVLRGLPPESTPDFLGTSVQEYLQRQQARRSELRALGEGFRDWLPNASEAEVITYFDRLKLQGEVAALKWMRDRSARNP